MRRLFGRREKISSHEVIRIMKRILLGAFLAVALVAGMASDSHAQFGGIGIGVGRGFGYGPSVGFGVGPSMGYRSGFGGYGYGPSMGARSSYYGGYGGGYRGGYGGYSPVYSFNRNSYPVYGRSYGSGYRRCR